MQLCNPLASPPFFRGLRQPSSHFSCYLPVDFSTGFIIHALFFYVNNYLWGNVLLPHLYQTLCIFPKSIKKISYPFLGPLKSRNTFFYSLPFRASKISK